MGAKLLSPSRGIFSEAQCRLRHRHRQRQRHSAQCGAVRCGSTRLATRLSKLVSQLELGLGFTRWSRQPKRNCSKRKRTKRPRDRETKRLETAPTVAAPANLFGTAKLSLAWLQVVTVWGRSALGNLLVSREQKKMLQNTCNFISFRLPAPNSGRI